MLLLGLRLPPDVLLSIRVEDDNLHDAAVSEKFSAAFSGHVKSANLPRSLCMHHTCLDIDGLLTIKVSGKPLSGAFSANLVALGLSNWLHGIEALVMGSRYSDQAQYTVAREVLGLFVGVETLPFRRMGSAIPIDFTRPDRVPPTTRRKV